MGKMDHIGRFWWIANMQKYIQILGRKRSGKETQEKADGETTTSSEVAK